MPSHLPSALLFVVIVSIPAPEQHQQQHRHPRTVCSCHLGNPGFNKPLLQSDNMIIGKASSKNENANEINSAPRRPFNAWKPLTTGEGL